MRIAQRTFIGLGAAGLLSMASLASAQSNAPTPTTSGEPASATPAPTTEVTEAGTIATTPADPNLQAVGGEGSSSSYTSVGDNKYHVDTTTRTVYPNRYMLAGGSIMFAAGYVPGVIVAATKDYEGDKNLYYPVAGPWMYLSKHDHSTRDKTLLVLDGILQDVGALQMLLAFVIPEKEERRWFEFGKNDTTIHVSPRVAQNQGGLWAYGRF